MIYIKKLKIQNFKSIENETFEFKPGLNILVGPNNAGKSNIIEAIELILGDVYLPNFEPTTNHFFGGEEDREIIIEASLECNDREIEKIFENEILQDTVEVRFRYSKEKGGCFELKKDGEWQIKGRYRFGYYWDFDRKLFFLRVKSLRNIMEIAPIRWKSPLKYFKDLIIRRGSKDKLERILERINEVKDELSNIEEVQEIIQSLLQIAKEQTGIRNIFLSPSPTKYSDFLNEMKILVDDGYLSEITNKGLGSQNLIIISLFRVMAKYMREDEGKFIIYGIDEPEIGDFSQISIIN